MYSVDLNIGTISGMTHMKMIFNFLTGTGKHFIGNALCSSDDCHATHSHFALFHNKQYLLQTPRRKKQEDSNLENEGARKWPSPSFHLTTRKFRAQTWQVKWGGTPSNWNDVPTGPWHKAVLSQDTSCLIQVLVPTHCRSVNWYCLVWVHLIKLALNMGVRFQLCQPENTIHSCLTEVIPSTWSKMGQNSDV